MQNPINELVSKEIINENIDKHDAIASKYDIPEIYDHATLKPPGIEFTLDDSPIRRTSKAFPITPTKSSASNSPIKMSNSDDDTTEPISLDNRDLLLSSSNSSTVRNTPVRNRRKSTSKESSLKSRRNSTNISQTSMIFRNLLILEDNLRSQAQEQKLLKWQYTTFLSCLAGVAAFSIYELYFSDIVFKSMYRFFLQFTACFIIVTLILFNLSGQYKRTIISPRRFFNSTNKGIRQFNVRLVKVHSTWDETITDIIRFITNGIADSNIWFLERVLSFGKSNRVVTFWNKVKIRAQPRIGATDVKLVLNPRSFSAEIREGWEIYRDEFWAREGARRRRHVNGK